MGELVLPEFTDYSCTYNLVLHNTLVTCSCRARETFCIPSARAVAFAMIALASPEHKQHINKSGNAVHDHNSSSCLISVKIINYASFLSDPNLLVDISYFLSTQRK